MKIELPALQRPGLTRRSGAASAARGGSFAQTLADAGGSGTASHAAPLNSLNPMLALQELPDALTGRRKARRRGEQLLDKLDGLRVSLLNGALPRSQLTELEQMVRTGRSEIDDPRLSEVLDDIELRVAVELAKLNRAAA